MGIFCMAWQGHRVRQLREARHYTREDFAPQVGVHSRMIARYEGNETEPTADVIAKMALVLGVSADYLLGLTDEAGANYIDQELSALERRLIISLRNKNLVEAAQDYADIVKSAQ